jgi:hypothetical protein
MKGKNPIKSGTRNEIKTTAKRLPYERLDMVLQSA